MRRPGPGVLDRDGVGRTDNCDEHERRGAAALKEKGRQRYANLDALRPIRVPKLLQVLARLLICQRLPRHHSSKSAQMGAPRLAQCVRRNEARQGQGWEATAASRRTHVGESSA